MSIDLIRTIRNRAGHMTFGSVLYNWSLGTTVPDRLLVIPPDGWPGSAERGRWLTSGAFMIEGETLDAPIGGDGWNEDENVSPLWLHHMHGFEWLRDLRGLGGDTARLQARAMIGSWLQHYQGWHETSWQSDLIGLRLYNWIGLFPFYGQSADQGFQDQVMMSLTRQARHLSRALPGTIQGLPLLHAIRGLVYAGIALEGREVWLEQALDLFERETGRQILPDGGHVSRSPAQLADALRLYIDIRNALRAGQYPVPEQVEHTIDRMAQALRFFRGSDKKLALFNGAQEGDDYMLDCIMLQSNARGRALGSLPHLGYERMTLGRTVVTIDAGMPPPHDYDATAHAAPLAFEFAYGKEKIFTSCGTHPIDPDWQAMLRGTAAHNTLSIDYRNVCEIREDGHFGRRPRHVTMNREDADGAVLLDASHDGYVPLNGVTHRRRFFLGHQGHDFRGEESLTCSTGIVKPMEVMVRFHLHPRIQVSLIQGGKEALLRMPGGAGWRFVHGSGALTLENSIYLGEGCRPRKTKQLVITGIMDSDQARIKWALQREAA
jgi:uncharacterized heparinase superfamily protein